jgi:hypothetical protein
MRVLPPPRGSPTGTGRDTVHECFSECCPNPSLHIDPAALQVVLTSMLDKGRNGA